MLPATITAVLELSGVSRSYGSVLALDGVSLMVPDGEVVGFLGPNGSGKTTTMRAIFGVVSIHSGAIRWNDRPLDATLRRSFGYMPEERGLYPGMQLREQLVYLARLHGMGLVSARRRSDDWIERLQLGSHVSSKIEVLSLGNQQRVQLAAALVHDPVLLVLDEPFSGLDPVGVDTMESILAESARAGTAVLFSSHQLDLVENVCDRVAIIDQGHIVADGSVADLTMGRGSRVVVDVAGGASESAWLDALESVATVVGRSREGLIVEKCLGHESREIYDLASKIGEVVYFSYERRHLSQVFRDAVGAAPSDPLSIQ
ncbi:MAG: ABC transporter ATP-binding protein [Ferrimicrobium sp.]